MTRRFVLVVFAHVREVEDERGYTWEGRERK